MTDNEMLTPQALAEELQVPLQTIYGWRTNKKGPRGIRIGKHLRFRRSDINAWLDAASEVA